MLPWSVHWPPHLVWESLTEIFHSEISPEITTHLVSFDYIHVWENHPPSPISFGSDCTELFHCIDWNISLSIIYSCYDSPTGSRATINVISWFEVSGMSPPPNSCLGMTIIRSWAKILFSKSTNNNLFLLQSSYHAFLSCGELHVYRNLCHQNQFISQNNFKFFVMGKQALHHWPQTLADNIRLHNPRHGEVQLVAVSLLSNQPICMLANTLKFL